MAKDVVNLCYGVHSIRAERGLNKPTSSPSPLIVSRFLHVPSRYNAFGHFHSLFHLLHLGSWQFLGLFFLSLPRFVWRPRGRNKKFGLSRAGYGQVALHKIDSIYFCDNCELFGRDGYIDGGLGGLCTNSKKNHWDSNSLEKGLLKRESCMTKLGYCIQGNSFPW